MFSSRKLIGLSLEVLTPLVAYWAALGLTDLFSALVNGDLSVVMYLPAGIKLMSLLILRWRGAIGIGLAIFLRLNFYDPGFSAPEALFLALMNAGVSFLVIQTYLTLFHIPTSLKGLDLWHIVALSVISSLANGIFFTSLLLITNHLYLEEFGSTFWMILVSNFVGNAVLTSILGALHLIYPRFQEDIKMLYPMKGNQR